MSRSTGTTIHMGGERGLWAAVILNAIEEAQGNIKGGGALAHTRARLRKEALDWLTKPNKGFNEVCALAGLEPLAVRERCKRKFNLIEGDGVVKDFPASEGTGGGSPAQDFTEIEILE